MAWDTERTRRRLLDAAVAEFSAYGLAGGRVDRIAITAGVNKQRIYKYFGGKSELFDAAVADEMMRVMALIPLKGLGKEAVLDYAGSMFDHHSEDRVLARLLFWEGLEEREPTMSRERVDLSREKVDGVIRALPSLSRAHAAELLLAIIVLSCGSPILEHVRVLLYDADPDRSRRRTTFIYTIDALVDSLNLSHPDDAGHSPATRPRSS